MKNLETYVRNFWLHKVLTDQKLFLILICRDLLFGFLEQKASKFEHWPKLFICLVHDGWQPGEQIRPLEKNVTLDWFTQSILNQKIQPLGQYPVSS